jgi:hypothetical protein
VARTKRRGYTGSKRFDKSCRSHGSCPWCANARKHRKDKQTPQAETLESLNDSTDSTTAKE